ncbi:ATP-dependent DEAD box helicase, putative [Plasmodium ovale curtisi]|uniref:ATP-dependent DEAD box helicase, putative n=2 Tax=Plasmodium ovale TaxID=36330 RepID=A0A1A8W295_PLAOA|nr:ATP-dependent DEAD box helicase, putative [Plasmodium ovale curtisi]
MIRHFRNHCIMRQTYIVLENWKIRQISYMRRKNISEKKINEEYKKAQCLIPLSENEILKIRNILIKITNEKELFQNIIQSYNIPAFFLQDVDVRNHFLKYLEEDTTHLIEIRDLFTKECINTQGSNSNSTSEYSIIKHEALNETQNDIKMEALQRYKINNGTCNTCYEKFFGIFEIVKIFKTFIKQFYHKQWIFYDHVRQICDFSELNEFRKKKKKARKLYLYVGPTNSGKTHEAFIHLVESKNGLYCAPLRLLAWEIHKKLVNLKKITNLLTGQEIIIKNNNSHTVCTIEMTPLDKNYDCAIIDEIQMINNNIRGYAWTNVLMQLKCEEIYLCGCENIVNLIKKLSDLLHDQLIIKRFKRLTKLELQDSTENLENLKTGDCIITFSRSSIMLLKKKVEKMNKRVFIIYGALPPESKTKQIELFNQQCADIARGRGTDLAEGGSRGGEAVLIATDVIGMGLNINIRRIIFYSLKKYDGDVLRYLSVSEILQISGRAGRFQENCYANMKGYITCVHLDDLIILRKIFKDKSVHYLTGNNLQKDGTPNTLADMINLTNSKNCHEADLRGNTLQSNAEHLPMFENFFRECESNVNLRAGYFPDFSAVEKLGNILENENKAKIQLYEILQILIDYSKLNDNYFFLTKNYNQMIYIAKWLKQVNLDKQILFIYTLAPVNINNILLLNLLKTFSICHSILGYVNFFECINEDIIMPLNVEENSQNFVYHLEKGIKDELFQKGKENATSDIHSGIYSHQIPLHSNASGGDAHSDPPSYPSFSTLGSNMLSSAPPGEPPHSIVGFEEYINVLEVYYEFTDLYCWMHTKFPDIYRNIDLVNNIKKKVSIEIINTLTRSLKDGEGGVSY